MGAAADHFATLGLPRSAALDGDALQQAWHAKAREAPSDEVNQAFEILSHPERRLKHLVELLHEGEAAPWRAVSIDPKLMSVFEKLGPLLQETAAFLKRKQAASTALAKALLSSEEFALRERLEALGTAIGEHRQHLESSLPDLDARRVAGTPSVIAELQTAQAHFAYLAKWQTQIREALLGLM